MSLRVFLPRAAAAVLFAVAISAFFLYGRWGAQESILTLLWCGTWATVLGCFGFRSMHSAMVCDPNRILGVILGGLFIRVFVLLVSQSLVFLIFGAEWGQRALLTTTLLYVLVLFVEVFTLNQALRSGTIAARDLVSTGTEAAGGPADGERTTAESPASEE